MESTANVTAIQIYLKNLSLEDKMEQICDFKLLKFYRKRLTGEKQR